MTEGPSGARDAGGFPVLPAGLNPDLSADAHRFAGKGASATNRTFYGVPAFHFLANSSHHRKVYHAVIHFHGPGIVLYLGEEYRLGVALNAVAEAPPACSHPPFRWPCDK